MISYLVVIVVIVDIMGCIHPPHTEAGISYSIYTYNSHLSTLWLSSVDREENTKTTTN